MSPLVDSATHRSLSRRAALYSGTTTAVISLAQALVFHPEGPAQIFVAALPFLVCTPITFFLTRAIARNRAKNLTETYLRFQRGDLGDDVPLLTDPEFRETRELFVRLARELHEAQRSLERRDAERRRLFSDVVHEIGTPVSSLLGLSEALESPTLLRDEATRAKVLASLSHESERLARFVEDLRDIAQLDDPDLTVHKVPTDVDELTREVVERMNRVGDRAGGEGRIVCEGRAPVVDVDPGRFEQILVNLLRNALRYAPEPAPIRVRLSAAGAARAALVVEDGGPGVPEAELAHLGERMRRRDASRTRKLGGTGLGLSIVSAIVAKHQGSLVFDRSPLGGLRITIEL